MIENEAIVEEARSSMTTEDRSETFEEWKERFKVIDVWDYDYKAAFEADEEPNEEGKWKSKYKHNLSPERYQQMKEGRWLDTKKSDISGVDVFVSYEKVLIQEMNRTDYLHPNKDYETE